MGVFCIKASVSISSDVTVRTNLAVELDTTLWLHAEHCCCCEWIPLSRATSCCSMTPGVRAKHHTIATLSPTSAQLITLRDTLQLLHAGPLTKVAACAAATAALWLTLKYGTHPLALPAMLCGIPAVFHVARLAAGWSIAELQDSGWLLQSKLTPVCLCTLVVVLARGVACCHQE